MPADHERTGHRRLSSFAYVSTVEDPLGTEPPEGPQARAAVTMPTGDIIGDESAFFLNLTLRQL